jgi:hypothetical protein
MMGLISRLGRLGLLWEDGTVTSEITESLNLFSPGRGHRAGVFLCNADGGGGAH